MGSEIRFSEYEKMVDSLNKFEYCKEFATTPWIVTEKIHGANFSFHTNGIDVRCARRRDLLELGESFFNYDEAEFMSTMPEKIKALFEAVREHHGDLGVGQVSVYGELFGGLYEHNDVIDQKCGNPVQHEIQYSPSKLWWAFDIAYRTISEPNVQVYVDPGVANELFERLGISYAKPLFVGPVNEAISYELGFDSKVPAALGLPPLPKGSNKAEGIVVKPIKTIYATDKYGETERVILKIKLPLYLESPRAPQKPEGKKKNANKNNPKSSNQPTLLAHVMPLATHKRLISAISKVGDPANEKITDDILLEFVEDTLTDSFEENSDNGVLWQTLSADEQKKVRGIVRNKGHQLLKKHTADMKDR